MERCDEEISATVLDSGEPISCRTLSIRSQVSASASAKALARFSAENNSVKALHLLIKRLAVDKDDITSDTSTAKRDPRARMLCIRVGSQENSDDVLCQQIYALYNKPKAAKETEDEEAMAIATACWAQERQARNDVLSTMTKHAPLSASAKALYASDIKCAEATARQDFGGDQGEETVSAFDSIPASAKKTRLPSNSSPTLFKSSGKTGFKSSSKNSDSQETTKLDMSNVLTVDSDDEEDEEMDAPMFVKASNNKRIISDDDDDEEDKAPPPKARSTPARKSRNVKRRLNASPAESKKKKQVEKVVDESDHQPVESENDAEDDHVEEPAVATKRRVVVSKTRIDEQGYMVTEKTYEEVELTAEEIEAEKKAIKKKMEEKKKKKLTADKAAKAKTDAKKQSGPPKQRDLRSFFSTK